MKDYAGYVLGSLFLVRGLLVATMPRLLFRLWDERMSRHFPSSFDRTAKAFSQLPDTTLRVMGVWLMLIGGLVLWRTSVLQGRQESARLAQGTPRPQYGQGRCAE